MRKVLTILVFILFAYLAGELVYLAIMGEYSISFQFILDFFAGIINAISGLNSPEFFDWKWFLLLFVNVVIALIITFFYTKRFDHEKRNDLVHELESSVEYINEDALSILEPTLEVKKVEQAKPILLDDLDEIEVHEEPITVEIEQVEIVKVDEDIEEVVVREEETITETVVPTKKKKRDITKSIRKKEISEIVSNRTNLSEYKAMQAINNLIEIVEDELNIHEVITIPRLGKFNKKHRRARTGVNPSTGQALKIDEHNTVTYKPSEWLKEYLNKEVDHKKKETLYMYKTDIIELVHRRTDFSKQSIHDALQITLEFITDNISDGVLLDDIGTFSLKEVAEHEAVNPSTKEKVVVPKHNKVVFKYDEHLKKMVNKVLKRKPLGKTEMTDIIAEKTGISQYKSKLVLNNLLEIIETELISNNEFILQDIGKFERKFREAKKGINPNTQEVIYIPSHHVVGFKPSKTLKDKVNW